MLVPAISCSLQFTTSARRIAIDVFRHERPDHTLEPNALVNELYLRLFRDESKSFSNRAHFFAVAAQTMRHILIDYARAGVTRKRGGRQQQVSLSDLIPPTVGAGPEEVLALDAALSRLASLDPRAAQVLETPVLWRTPGGRGRGGPPGVHDYGEAGLENRTGLAQFSVAARMILDFF